MKCVIVTVLFVALCCVSVKSYKLLCLAPIAAHSHFQIASAVCKGLARKGHEVTVVSPFPNKVKMDNWRDISVAEVSKDMDDMRKHLYDMNKLDIVTNLLMIFKTTSAITEKFLKHENIKKLLKSNEKFDGVVMEYFLNEALMGFASHYEAPLILISPMPVSTWTNHLNANPGSSAYIPNLMSRFGDEMSFSERVTNLFYDFIDSSMKEFIIIPEQERQLKKYMPNAPPMSEVRYSTSIMLINSHESFTSPAPKVPNMVQIGGYHVEPTKELPEDLKSFLDGAKDGVVLFSMGSNLKSADLAIETRKGILRAFSKLKQMVLWKFEEDIEGLPPNIKVHKWLPQQDILAHPNVVCFITHGGILSIIEAVYHGVPLIGIPVFGDQMMNMARAVNNGFAVEVPLSKLSEETLSKALAEILNTPKYRDEMKRRSQIMHDREVNPLDSAVYWIEYAIRHKGAKHLRSAALKLAWYQRSLTDVYVCLGAVTAAIILVVLSLVKLCSRKPYYSTADSSKKDR